MKNPPRMTSRHFLQTIATVGGSTAVWATLDSWALAKPQRQLWYTGIYTKADGEATVATFVDALAWQTLAFTKPMTICGYPGFWSEAWEPILD